MSKNTDKRQYKEVGVLLHYTSAYGLRFVRKVSIFGLSPRI